VKLCLQLLSLALSVAMSSHTFARLNSPLEACIQQYGEPTSGPQKHLVVAPDGAHLTWPKYGFSKAGINIEVICEKSSPANVCEITYRKADGSAFNAAEVETLLSKNSGVWSRDTSPWIKAKDSGPSVSMWQTGDGMSFAKLDEQTKLAIWNKAWDEVVNTKKELTDKEKAEKDFEGL
jgi:hypothetical protein